MPVDTSDIQAIVLGNIAGYPLVRHLIFAAGDAAALKAFVPRMQPLLTFGTNSPPRANGWIVNLSFAAPAMKAVLPDDLYGKLETTFRAPPDAERLGDVGTSAPEHWWEERFKGEEVGLFVHLHAVDDANLEAGTARVLEEAQAAGLTELIPREGGGRLDGRFLAQGPAGKGARLHFGYIDGLSNSKVAWSGTPDAERPIDHRSVVLGYYDDAFPSAPARSPGADFFRDSSYIAFRWIYQDVGAFEQYLTARAGALFPALPLGEARELLAAKIMGRWRDGTPLVLSPDSPQPELGDKPFGYGGDVRGIACPVSAHIRVMNPRDQPLSGMAALTGIPQVVRRGMPYGPEMEGEADDGVDRGIYGIFVCASLREQFMRLAAWGARNNFSKVFPASGKDQDALIGNRAIPGATGTFTIPEGPAGGGTVDALPDFMRTKATQYLMIPSGRALSRMFPIQ
jgi:Dyp-type peroxidase family